MFILKEIFDLQLFVDWEIVGQTAYPKQVSAAKDPLDPSMILIGCHKTSSEPDYRGYTDGQFDEVAMWARRLLNNETRFFLGGYGK